MSHQVITRMAYNAKTKQIETWQHSNNVWPTTDHFYALDVKTDEQMFEFITLIANGLWQGRKWRKAFKTLFEEYPELVRSSYEHELRGQPWKAYCAICKKYEELAQSKCNEIQATYRDCLTQTDAKYMEEIKISNRQIALMAFDRLRKEDKTDSALKLARCMLHGTSISLGIGDIDWEIDRAIQQCGGVPRTGYRYTAYFHFNRNTEMAKEIYDKIVKELYG